MSEPLPSFKRVGPPTHSGQFCIPEAPSGERLDRADDTPTAPVVAEKLIDKPFASARSGRSAGGARVRLLWSILPLLGIGFVVGGGLATAVGQLHRPSSGELNQPFAAISQEAVADQGDAPPADADIAPPADENNAPPGPTAPDLSPILSHVDALQQRVAELEGRLQADSERLVQLEQQLNKTQTPSQTEEPLPRAGDPPSPPPLPKKDADPVVEPGRAASATNSVPTGAPQGSGLPYVRLSDLLAANPNAFNLSSRPGRLGPRTPEKQLRPMVGVISPQAAQPIARGAAGPGLPRDADLGGGGASAYTGAGLSGATPISPGDPIRLRDVAGAR